MKAYKEFSLTSFLRRNQREFFINDRSKYSTNTFFDYFDAGVESYLDIKTLPIDAVLRIVVFLRAFVGVLNIKNSLRAQNYNHYNKPDLFFQVLSEYNATAQFPGSLALLCKESRAIWMLDWRRCLWYAQGSRKRRETCG